jgi:phenylacetate-CoA ligase
MQTTERIVERAGIPAKLALLRESERWPRERLEHWQQERLDALLEAARGAPFWGERIEEGCSLEELPLLERAEVAEQLERMRPPGERLVIGQRTSGSTGKPIWVEHGPETVGYGAAARLRQLIWFGLPPSELPQLNIHNLAAPSEPVLTRIREEPALFELNPWRLDAAAVARAHDEVVAAGGVRLLGANTHIFTLWAEHYERADRDGRELGAELAVVGSELTEPEQRRKIEQVFGCRTAEMYGAREVSMLATECAEGSLHVNEEVVLLEVLGPDGAPAPPGRLGEVAVTALHNTELPLIRYRIGDAAAFEPGACPCGRTLRRLDLRVGHLEEMVMRRDGSLMHPRFFRTLYEVHLGDRLRAFHTVQEGPARFVAHLELQGDLPETVAAAPRDGVSEHLGERAEIELRLGEAGTVRSVRNGKLRSFTRSYG